MKIIVKSLSINGTYLMLIPWKYIVKTSKTSEVLVFLLDCRWYQLPVHTFLMKSFCRLADSTRHHQTAFPPKVFMTCWDFYKRHLNAWKLTRKKFNEPTLNFFWKTKKSQCAHSFVFTFFHPRFQLLWALYICGACVAYLSGA